MLVMDNTSFHHTECIEQMCAEIGIKLMHLPLYLPDLNLIKKVFIITVEVQLFQLVLQYYQLLIHCSNSTLDLSLLHKYRFLNLFCDVAMADRAVSVKQ